MRSYAAAEKNVAGMALKIRTRVEDIPDGEETIRLILVGWFSEVAEHVHDVSRSPEYNDNHEQGISSKCKDQHNLP